MRFQLPSRHRHRSQVRFRAESPDALSGAGATVAQPGRGRRRDRLTSVFPRRRRPAPIVRRTVLAVLLAACVALLTLSYRSGDSAMLPGQQQALEVFAPVEHVVVRAWAPLAAGWDWCERLLRSTSETPRLEARVSELERDLAVMRTTEAENARLRDMLAMKERGRFPRGYDQVAGAVVARSATDITRSLVVNLGTADGIAVDDPVMVARGLIGRVEAVSANAARVGLLLNPGQAVSATVVESGGSGVLRVSGTEGSPVLDLGYVSQRMKVGLGDLVVTSGWSTGSLSSIFPAGIPIGTVTSVGNSPTDLYKTVQVAPFADFDRIDEVLVLVPASGRRIRYSEPQKPDFREARGTAVTGARRLPPSRPGASRAGGASGRKVGR